LLLAGCADFSRGAPARAEMGGSGGTGDAGDREAGTLSFATDVYPLLTPCQTCHAPSGAASTSALIFSGSAATDYPSVTRFVDTSAPASSRLLSKMSGNGHGGGTVYASGTPEYETISSWIHQGAPP